MTRAKSPPLPPSIPAVPLTRGSAPGGGPRRTPLQPSRFGDWLAASGKRPTELAAELGCSLSAIYNIRAGHFRPGRDLALAIERVSKRAVPVSSWARKE